MTKSTFLLGFWGILGSHFFSEDWLVQGNTSLILRKSSQQTHLPKADFHRCSDHHNNMTIWRFDSNSQAQTQRCWDSFFFAPEIDSILQNPLDFRAKNHRTWLNTKTKNHQTSQNKDSADFTSTMTSPCEKHPPGGTGYSALIFSQLRHEVRLSIQKNCLQKTSSGTFCWGKWSCWCFLARIFFGFLFLPEKRRVEKRNNFSPADSSFFWKTFWEMFFLGEEERGPILGGERKSCFTDLEASFPHSARQTSHWEFLLVRYTILLNVCVSQVDFLDFRTSWKLVILQLNSWTPSEVYPPKICSKFCGKMGSHGYSQISQKCFSEWTLDSEVQPNKNCVQPVQTDELLSESLHLGTLNNQFWNWYLVISNHFLLCN